MPLDSRKTENRFLLSLATLWYLRHLLITLASLSASDTLTPYTQSPLTQHFHFTAFCLQGGQTSRVHQFIKPTVLNPNCFKAFSSTIIQSSKAYLSYGAYCIFTYPPTSPNVGHTITLFLYGLSPTVGNTLKNMI